MRIRKATIILILFTAIFSASGCGEGGGGGSTELRTSYLIANAKTATLDSDVVSWVDALGVKATACAATSFKSVPVPDSVDVEVISKAFSNSGTTLLPVRIESATISYTPANATTPAMASEFQTIGTILSNGGTATVPVRIVSQEQKLRLQPVLACTSTIYSYYTTITLNVTELGSNASGSVSTSMQLRLADYIDK